MKLSKCMLFLATSLLSITVASCDNSGTSNELNIFEVPESGFDTTKDVTITFYHTMNKTLQEVLEMYIQEFEDIYPNITVEHHAIGGYDDVKDQNTAAISSGKNDCDIAYCYPDHLATYNKAKAVVALDKLIDSTVKISADSDETFGFTQEQKDDFITAYWNEGLSLNDGHMYCLPFSKSSEVMYYNKTFFTEHDLTVPTTWDEMEEVMKKIKQIDAKSFPLGYDSSSNLFITLAEQNKAGYTSMDENNHYIFDNETNRATLTRLSGWYKNGYITTKGLNGTYTSSLFVETDPNKQKSYMSIGSSAGATNQIPEVLSSGKYPFEVGIARVPQVDATNNPKVIEQGPDICIFNSKDDQKIMASWLFVKYLTTSVEFQAEFSMTSGYTPVIKSVNDYKVYSDWLDEADGYSNLAALSTKTCVEQADWYFTSAVFEGSSEARDQVGQIVDKVLPNVDLIDEAFSDALAICNATK